MNTSTTVSVTLRPLFGGALVYVGSFDYTINISASHQDPAEAEKKIRDVLESIRAEIDKALQ